MTFGDLKLGARHVSLNWQFLGLAIFVVGLQAFFLGCIAQVLFDYTERKQQRWLRLFPYTRTVLLSVMLLVAGHRPCDSVGGGLREQRAGAEDRRTSIEDHFAVTGLAFGIAGAQLFVFVLLLHGAVVATARRTLGRIH